MRLFRRKSDAGKGKAQVASQETQGQIFVNSLCSNAENVFAQLQPLVNELKMVEPFGVGRNGARLPLARTPELMALQAPNEEMGWAEFADLMFSTWLTEKELNIHVWKNQRGKVYGYTVLPVNCRKTIGGVDYFEAPLASGGIARYGRDEVMTLRFSRNPRNIDSGISPGIASMVWAQIDDVMAQYQLGHFENGAVPAYITIIRASSREKYFEKRKEMEHGFHGAKNKGKTLYLWRQFLDDGSEKDEVEVKTIQGSNASLAIKDIMAIVNDKLNKAFGVSNFILGDDSSAKYDNAELSQQQFLSHRVYPALYTFWSQFQHELDRITGGLGYSISWELEIPELTDRLKVKAETKKIETETRKVEDDRKKVEAEIKKVDTEREKLKIESNETVLRTLTTAIKSGATVESALTALGLGKEWRKIAEDIYTAPDYDPESVELIPTQNTVDHIPHHCSHCHHTNDANEPEFSPDEIIERAIYGELVNLLDSLINHELEGVELMTEEEIDELIRRIESKLLEVAAKGATDSVEQVDKSISGLPPAIIVGVVNGQRPASNKELVSTIKEEETHNGEVKAEQISAEKMHARTEELVKRYSEDAAEIIRNTLNSLSGQALSSQQIRARLQEAVPKARAAMIARNETVEAFRIGQLEETKQIATKYSLKVRKTWHAHPGECPICAAMDGKTVDLEQSFPAETVDKDGVTYAYEHTTWNDSGATCNAHVNCRCYFTFEVVYG